MVLMVVVVGSIRNDPCTGRLGLETTLLPSGGGVDAVPPNSVRGPPVVSGTDALSMLGGSRRCAHLGCDGGVVDLTEYCMWHGGG